MGMYTSPHQLWEGVCESKGNRKYLIHSASTLCCSRTDRTDRATATLIAFLSFYIYRVKGVMEREKVRELLGG